MMETYRQASRKGIDKIVLQSGDYESIGPLRNTLNRSIAPNQIIDRETFMDKILLATKRHVDGLTQGINLSNSRMMQFVRRQSFGREEMFMEDLTPYETAENRRQARLNRRAEARRLR